jgi:diguanylate cyclase (GGDEF)-like protein
LADREDNRTDDHRRPALKPALLNADSPSVVSPSRMQAGASPLDALLDAAAGILAADSLGETLGRIAEHLRELLAYEDLSVYEIEPGGRTLKPVFAVGAWVDEIMAGRIDIESGAVGWVIRNRRTRNVPNTREDPVCTVIPGTDDDPEAFVCVPLLAHDRVVGTLNVYRVGADVAFSDAEVELVERFATMAALAYDSARQRDTLRKQVATDGLTGLLNHRSSQERLHRELERAEQDIGQISVVVLDLDHFKLINDSYGHAEGDRVLVDAAAKLRGAVRDADAVGRLGGEEFVLILPGVGGDRAAEAAERARAAIGEVRVHGHSIGCSAGVASWPEDAADAAELLEHADMALYAAKHGGRRQTRRYAASLSARPSVSDERCEIEALLARPGAIRPVFQPLLELATGRAGGYEALSRIKGDRGPDQWFAQAHRCGLGAELEAAALRNALAVRDRPPGTFLSLNLSPAALLTEAVHDALPENLSGIVIELSEHELFSAGDVLDGRLHDLRARGARIALDDAGAGYSGLQQLIRVAPEILKIDASLVRGAHADPSRFALLQALATFASGTGAAVCGKGIEDLADLKALADLDATYAQGFALSRPAAAWPSLLPGASRATAAPVHQGLRVAGGGASAFGSLERRLVTLADDLSQLRHAEELSSATRHAARILNADTTSLLRLVDGALEEVTGEDARGGRCRPLSDHPGKRAVIEERTTGQVIFGDPESHPDEVAELQQLGHNALLMVPLVIGDDTQGLMQVYRRHPQAFTAAEIDRARIIALQFAAALERLYGWSPVA